MGSLCCFDDLEWAAPSVQYVFGDIPSGPSRSVCMSLCWCPWVLLYLSTVLAQPCCWWLWFQLMALCHGFTVHSAWEAPWLSHVHVFCSSLSKVQSSSTNSFLPFYWAEVIHQVISIPAYQISLPCSTDKFPLSSGYSSSKALSQHKSLPTICLTKGGDTSAQTHVSSKADLFCPSLLTLSETWVLF